MKRWNSKQRKETENQKHTPGPWKYDGEYIWAEAIKGYVADPNTEDGCDAYRRERYARRDRQGFG